MRKVYVVGLLAAIALVGLGLFTVAQPQTVAVVAQDVETGSVAERVLSESVESSGRIAAAQSISLTFGTSGTVAAVEVEVGDVVTAGQRLAALDTSSLDYQIALEEQSLIVQQLSYDQLVAEPSASEIAQARASLASAQSQLASALASLESAPNQTTLNCSSLDDAQQNYDDALAAYDDYVAEGYEWDANFIPDSESTAGVALTSAETTLRVERAQCDNGTSDEEYAQQVAAAQASVDQAQAALDELLEGPTDTEIESAQAQLAQTQLQLDNARAGLEDAYITAPFDGVITSVDIVRGQIVSSGSSAFTLQDISSLHVDVDVDELDIPQIILGQSAVIAPEALDSVSLEGVVSRIAPAGDEQDGIVTYNVRVDLTDLRDLPIYVGMTADVEILLEGTGAVLSVPTAAIQREGTREFVQVVNDDGSTSDVSVTSGDTVGDFTAVEGELTEGMEVVIPAQETQAGGGLPGPFGG
jgi:HlyD family secretion protein